MRIIEYKIEDFKDICSMADFYEQVGLHDQATDTWGFKDVRQVFMNAEECIKLLDFLQNNQKKQKDKLLRKMPKQLYLANINGDWANLSPTIPSEDMACEKSKLYVYDLQYNAKDKNEK